LSITGEVCAALVPENVQMNPWRLSGLTRAKTNASTRADARYQGADMFTITTSSYDWQRPWYRDMIACPPNPIAANQISSPNAHVWSVGACQRVGRAITSANALVSAKSFKVATLKSHS
jgi:hypothetical protein